MKMRVLALAAAMFLLPTSAHADEADREKARTNFLAADANSDGKLSRNEFRVFIDAQARDNIGRAGMVRRFGAYDRAFRTLDTNKDGSISPRELAAARRS